MASVQLGNVLRQIQRLYSGGSAAGLTDSALLDRFASERNEDAFAALVARHGPMVLAVCRGVLRDPVDAEDAFQATFLILVRRVGSLRVQGSLGGWLHRVAHRVAVRANVDSARRMSRERRGVEMDAIAGRDGATGDRWASHLHEEIARLPEAFRRAVVLCDLEGMTQVEAARELGCGEATLRRRLAGAHERLKRRLERSGFAGAVGPLAAPLVKLNPVPAAWIDAVAHSAAAEAAGQTVMSTTGHLAAAVLGAMTRARHMKLAVLLVASIGLATAWNAVRGPHDRPPAADRDGPGRNRKAAEHPATHREPLAAGVDRPVGAAKPAGDDLPNNTRSAVVGRVIDVTGNPLAFVSVGLAPVANNLDDFYMNNVVARTITQADGRFAIPPVEPGDYQIAPLPDIEIEGGETRPEWLPRDYRKYAAQGAGLRRAQPLTAVFPKHVVSVKAGAAAPQVELRAIPQVLFSASIVDSQGKPASALSSYRIDGRLDAEPWSSEFRPDHDRVGGMSVLVPLGLKDAQVDCAGENVYWTWDPGGPRVNFYHVRLKVVDGDRLGILIQRYKSATLEIRLRTSAGELPRDPNVRVSYPIHRGGDGGPIPNRVAADVYRLDQELLPGRNTVVQVRAPGFKSMMTKPFQFTEEGQHGVVELTLEPGQSTPGIRLSDAVPIVLRTPVGKPIIAPAPPVEPARAIVCRAVDKDTTLPVAGAVVTFGVEQRTDEDGKDDYDSLESHKTKTDHDGRFTVDVPEKYLPDPSPARWLNVWVTISHPRYVTYLDIADTREIAKNGISDTFPAFRTVKLLPARTLMGRLLGADGRPLPKVPIYKQYDLAAWPRDAEHSVTGEDGRFSARVPLHAALKLEFRAREAARLYHDVGPNQTDLGDIRLHPGVRITGRVVDASGKPVPWISVTTPATPDSTRQPNFVYTTDDEGRFRSGGLPHGNYLVTVGGMHRTAGKEESPTPAEDAPDVYVPVPVVIRDGDAESELTLRPVESVRFKATFFWPLTKIDPRASPKKAPPDDGDPAALAEAYKDEPAIFVRGKYHGMEWASQYSFAAAAEQPGTYTVRVPKGLTDATLFLGMIQGLPRWFRLDPKSPELFGTAYRLDRVDADRLGIQIRPYRLTTLRVVVSGSRPDEITVRPRYVRQAEMKAAGVVFDPLPPLSPDTDGKFRLYVLPGEELEISATARGNATATARVELAEGETRELRLRFTKNERR
ncbi:MAG: sigma-70 family RNA polymerase sigma factor [Isosphaeraceae bacterium]